jgi:hypothetical protein
LTCIRGDVAAQVRGNPSLILHARFRDIEEANPRLSDTP